MFSIFIFTLLNGIIFSVYCFFVSYLLLQKKEKSIINIIKAFIPFFIMYYCVLCLLDSIYSIFFSGLLAFFFIKVIFKESFYMSLVISLIIHTLKMVNKILVLTILNNPNLLLINTYKTLDWSAFYINLVSLIISGVVVVIFKKALRRLIKYVSGLKNRKTILLIAVYFNFILIIIYQPPIDFFSLRTVTDFFLIFTVTWLGIFSISSEMKMESLVKYYQEIFEYSKANEELLTNYKMQVHENKNRLLMIRGMLEQPTHKIEGYIDGILKEINESKSNANYWLTELKYIPLPGVRNFINYKLIQLRELGTEVEVFVSCDLDKIDCSTLSDDDYNQLTTMLGVVLDNMIDSVSKIEKKLISVNLYVDGDKIHGEFVNNFTEEIDINRLNEIGYSTKGQKRGVGLSLVAKITRFNKRFECIPEIVDNFFIQHITIKMYNKKNIQKKSKK